jgi:hypothetical protein
MPTVSKNGLTQIKAKIKTPLSTAAALLQSQECFDKVQPMFELVFKTISEIEQKWEKTEDR